MKMMKKVLSMILALVLVLGLLPATAMTTEASGGYVYLSISFDGKYIQDKNGSNIAYMPVAMEDIAAIDLAEYGLENMLFDADEDGEYETTALQLIIYAHENIYGGDWSEVTFDALPGSSYFRGGVFGFTENLMYFHNGDFPVDESMTSDFMTVGATSDRIVLEAGDFLDIASFTCYSFLWDQLGGFHFFANRDEEFSHYFAAEAGETKSLKLMHSFCDLMFGQAYLYGAADYEVFYGKTYGEAMGTFMTDGDGNFDVNISAPGTYYIWCDGARGSDDGTHGTCDGYFETQEPCVVSAPAYAMLVINGVPEPTEPEPTEPEVTEPEVTEPEATEPEATEPEATEPEATEPEQPRQPQSVSAVLKATLAQQAATVYAPAFGTNYGEWTVFGLARGNYYENDSQYYADYYDRIVEYVNSKAAELDMNGALDKNKSTDNSRLIMALASIGRDATSVGNWDLVGAYSANGINWIKKQGMNGTIWTLIALDCGGYETSDPTIRQQCVDAIVSAQHNDGGWSLVTAKAQPSNVDITGMTLTALYPYRDQPAVAAACETAFNWLSESQLENGGFPYGTGETSESCVWAIVAATTWGINPDTDPRFIKNGNSAVDNLLTYYLEDQAMFEHGRGAGANAMATDQATYGLVAYDRLIKGMSSLYDYSDVDPYVPPVPDEMVASLGLPDKINAGSAFNGVISINMWDNEAGYKLIDLIVIVPEGVSVTDVTAGSKLGGGEVSWNLEEETGKLRIVYFDANENNDLTVSGSEFPAELFTIGFETPKDFTGEKVTISISGMSIKLTSDSEDEASMVIVKVDSAEGDVGGSGGSGNITIVPGLSFSAVCLYQGDDVDIIPSTKKAVAVAVTGIANGAKLTFRDGENETVFLYSKEVTDKTGVATYVALVDSEIEMESFVDENKYTITNVSEDAITFGDVNSDGVINAQDALAAVDTWLRKGDQPTDIQILAMNVNGDSRINTFDALGIVEAFVNGTEYGVVTKAATITTKQ